MKRAWLFLFLISMVTAPALCMAEQLPADFQAEKVDEAELAQNAGQGFQFQASLPRNTDKIVIWDEWACAGHGSKADNSSFVGQVSINYGQRQATMSTGNAPR